MIGISVALLVIIWICFKRPAAAIALVFLLVGFVWRLVGAAYLNMAGPLYSYEAELMVGGDSLAANMFGAFIALTVGVMVLFVSPNHVNRELASLQQHSSVRGRLNLGDLVFGLSALFVAALFVDLLRIGVVPLFDCVERYEYLEIYAGAFHRFLFKYGSLVALHFGIFTVFPRLVGGNYDWRFLLLVAALFIYLSLTGNRFSAFYSLSLFFLTPFCLVWMQRSMQEKSGSTVISASQVTSAGNYRLLWMALPIFGGLVVALSLMNSYANIRYENSACSEYRSHSKFKLDVPEPTRNAPPPNVWLHDLNLAETVSRFVTPEVQMRFMQRILVQPIHMYFLTSDRVINRGDWQPAEALSFIFDPNYKTNGNRSIRFLMNRTLPSERATYLESVGNQFAGGYPEVLLELAGPWGTWIPVMIFAAIAGWLLRFWMLAVLRGRFLSAFFAAYVNYAFVVMYVGGMLNFLIVWTFWVKVLLLVLFAWLEPYCERRGYRLLPWHILPLPQSVKTS